MRRHHTQIGILQHSSEYDTTAVATIEVGNAKKDGYIRLSSEMYCRDRK